MEYIESLLFSKLVNSYMEDEEYAAFQWDLALHPEKGWLDSRKWGFEKSQMDRKRKR